MSALTIVEDPEVFEDGVAQVTVLALQGAGPHPHNQALFATAELRVSLAAAGADSTATPPVATPLATHMRVSRASVSAGKWDGHRARQRNRVAHVDDSPLRHQAAQGFAVSAMVKTRFASTERLPTSFETTSRLPGLRWR